MFRFRPPERFECENDGIKRVKPMTMASYRVSWVGSDGPGRTRFICGGSGSCLEGEMLPEKALHKVVVSYHPRRWPMACLRPKIPSSGRPWTLSGLVVTWRTFAGLRSRCSSITLKCLNVCLGTMWTILVCDADSQALPTHSLPVRLFFLARPRNP